MKKINRVIGIFSLVGLSFVSCKSIDMDWNKETKSPKLEYCEDVYKYGAEIGDFRMSVDELKLFDTEANKIDVQLTSGMLSFLDRDFYSSTNSFNKTNLLMEQKVDKKSAGQSTKAVLTSESLTNYAGAGYEYCLVDSMSAAGFIKENEYDNARAMMRRFQDNHASTVTKIIEDLALAQDSADKSQSDEKNSEKYAESLSQKPAKYTSQYSLSPFCAYLGTLLFVESGDKDIANEWKTLYEQSPKLDVKSNGETFSISKRDDSLELSEDIEIIENKSKGRLNVLTLSNYIANRDEASLPFFKDWDDILITYPKFAPSTNVVKSIKVQLSDGSSETPLLIEDFDAAVFDDVAAKQRAAYTRSFIRCVSEATIRTSEAVAMTAASYTGGVGTIGAVIGLAVVESIRDASHKATNRDHADLRQGQYFPSKAHSASFTLNPGKYNGKVIYTLSDGSQKIDNFETTVVAGKNAIVLSDCISPFTVGRKVVIDEK